MISGISADTGSSMEVVARKKEAAKAKASAAPRQDVYIPENKGAKKGQPAQESTLRQLSRCELKDLANRYNMSSLEKKERDTLLDELLEKGVISKQDHFVVSAGALPQPQELMDGEIIVTVSKASDPLQLLDPEHKGTSQRNLFDTDTNFGNYKGLMEYLDRGMADAKTEGEAQHYGQLKQRYSRVYDIFQNIADLQE